MQLILVGFATLLAQVVLLREIGVASYGGEIVYVLGLAIWLAAGAVGAVAGRARPQALPVAACVLAAAVPAGLVLARGLRPLLGAAPGADLELGRLLVGTVLVLAPSGAAAGVLFRLAAARRIAGGGVPGRTYAFECLGAAAGGAVASAWPALGWPALLAASLASLAGLGLVASGSRAWRWAALGALVPLLVIVLVADTTDRALTRWTHPHLVDTRDTPHGRLTIEVDQGRLALFQDDNLIFSSEDPSGEELVHLAATQRDTLGRVLVLGGWLENLARQLAPYRPTALVQVEPDAALVRHAFPHLPDRDPPSTVILADPRAWLPASQGRFDLVVSALPDPLTARANRYWTQEFAELCARRLTPSGVLALRLHTSENLWTPRQARRVASVYRALRNVFADVQVLPGQATVLLASQRTLARHPTRLAARFTDAAPSTDLASPAWLRWRWTGDRTAEVASALAEARVPANTDTRPVCFGDTLLWNLGRLFPGLGWRSAPRPGRWLAPTMAVAVVLVLLIRRRGRGIRVLVAAYAGLAAMMLTSVLLLHHQTRLGVLYRDLGVLLTLVMLGQALGAHLGSCRHLQRAGRWRLPGLLVVLSFWSFLATLGLLADGNLAASALWLTGTGMVTAMIFASTACTPGADVGRLYAADLGGGGLGALAAAVLLIPFSGLPATALTVATLAFPAALAVWPFGASSGPGTS